MKLRNVLMAGTAAILVIGCGAPRAAQAAATFSVLTDMSVTATPQNNVGGKLTSFDISYYDPVSNDYYLADRSNAAVDYFSTTTHTQIGSFGGSSGGSNVFVGVQPPPPALINNDLSGPNGTATGTVGSTNYVFAGDGNDTVKVFNAATNALVANISLGPASDQRADEMAYNPAASTLLVASPAASSAGAPYVTLINAAANAATTNPVISRVVLNGLNGTPDTTSGGIEQPLLYNGKFFVAIPQNGTTGPGGVASFDGTTGAFITYTDLSTLGISTCGPNGLTVSSSGQFLLGCNISKTTQVVVTPTASGGITAPKVVTGVGGADEVNYDAFTNEFLIGASGNGSGPVLGIIDAATDTLVQTIATVIGAHSVAADSQGDIYVPLGSNASNTIADCKNGCVRVYAPVSAVPLPASLPMFGAALLALGAVGFGARRRTRIQARG